MYPLYQAPPAQGLANIPPGPPIGLPRLGTPDRTLLDATQYASEEDFVPLMLSAIHQGADVNITDETGRHLLEIAVQRNSTRIANALIVQGAFVPDAPPDGFDLLMQAAVHDNPDMINLLIQVADMQPDYVDHTGKTALHYAAKSQSAQALKALLDYGADVNSSVSGMQITELDEIFGREHGLFEAGIKPLSIAVATGNSQTVQLLLERAAKISTGRTNPLLIAVKKQDARMLEMLIKHCARSGKLAEVITQGVLSAALTVSRETALLHQILGCQAHFATDGPSLEDALRLAVWLGHIDQAAVLISAGAQPTPGTAHHYGAWEYATQNNDPAMLNVLVASRHREFANLLKAPGDGSPALLRELSSLIAEPLDLAVNGIFEMVIQPAIPELTEIADLRSTQSPAQTAAATAHALLSVVPASPPVTETPESIGYQSANPVPASQFQYALPPVRHSQTAMINQAIQSQHQAICLLAESASMTLAPTLTTCLSSDFLSAAREIVYRSDSSHSSDSSDRSVSVQSILKQKMQQEHGLPQPLIELISQAWQTAENVIARDSSSSAMPDASTVSRLMANVLFCQASELKPPPGSFLDRCNNTLISLLTAERAQWNLLITQPAEFLRTLEQRSGLRPVDVQSLTKSLVSATGLPASVCVGLARCWQRAVTDARQGSGSGGASGRFHALDIAFATYWQGWLEEHAVDAGKPAFPVTRDEFAQLLDSCSQILRPDQRALKRMAAAEAAGAPPHKPARRE